MSAKLSERVRGRKPLSRTIEVKFPKENPEFTFTFSRIPRAEVFGIQLKAQQSVEGLDESAREKMFGVFFTLYTYEAITRHLKDWVNLVEDPLPYSKENAEVLFTSALGNEDIAELVASYSEAVVEDEKKSKPAV